MTTGTAKTFFITGVSTGLGRAFGTMHTENDISSRPAGRDPA